MTKPEHAPGYVPNEAYSQEDWDEVSDNPELTDEQLAQLRPAKDVLPPALYEALVNRGGRPPAVIRKVPVTIRLDPHVVDAFKATGPGWQTRMNDALAKAATGLPRA
ncbi:MULTISPECIES: BrnA antitoxin family protein [Methylobacterium]|uniref:BrnA antitoxin family protein n=1 Tax=Methylobacterium thuringiense TaxID=1003091 RepID=A0ABQ4TKH0_9HYPH|nr:MULTISPECIES: BrnA antitoxin family protein [Methylobacterium]TXN20293.1 BrnA antitoxin family protein [Methylobacterium sp. WL9]GJE55416.1 hypothetical protein EKPJFOCH_1907 [Methylobacterium thuringiense]